MTHENPVIAVVGLGTMGCGIAVAALTAGIAVRLVDADSSATDLGYKRIVRRLQGHVETGLLPSNSLEMLREADVAADLLDACDAVDMVIEAVPEAWAAKRKVLESLSAMTDGVIATNTSAFPVDRLASSVSRPSRFLGLHFFNPAEWIPGVELVPGEQTSLECVETAIAMLHRMSKEPTVVKSSPGFLANRLQLALFAECMRCVDEGLASPQDVDRVVSSTFGFRLPAFGPFAIADMAGLDVYESIFNTLTEAYGERFRPPDSFRRLIEQERFGVKVRRGYAPYSEAEVEELVPVRDAVYSRLLLATRSGQAPADPSRQGPR